MLTCCIVGFPLGATPAECKAHEAKVCIAHGAEEIDMVINVGALKDGLHETVRQDIAAVKAACGKVTLKVILETCLLTDAEKHGRANFVSTPGPISSKHRPALATPVPRSPTLP